MVNKLFYNSMCPLSPTISWWQITPNMSHDNIKLRLSIFYMKRNRYCDKSFWYFFTPFLILLWSNISSSTDSSFPMNRESRRIDFLTCSHLFSRFSPSRFNLAKALLITWNLTLEGRRYCVVFEVEASFILCTEVTVRIIDNILKKNMDYLIFNIN